jgi:hypothetical protein
LDEDTELQLSGAGEAFPTTLDGFKKSARYVLAKHLGMYGRSNHMMISHIIPVSILCFHHPSLSSLRSRFSYGAAEDEVLHPWPQPPLGFFKGQAIHARANVHRLRTRAQWYRVEARQIKPADSNRPVKRITPRPVPTASSRGGRRGGGAAAPHLMTRLKVLDYTGDLHALHGAGRAADADESADAEAGGDGMVSLFGEWQTEPFTPPPYNGGPLPLNAHGNFELWRGDTRFLPAGLVYLRDNSKLRHAAKQLDVPFGPVVVRQNAILAQGRIHICWLHFSHIFLCPLFFGPSIAFTPRRWTSTVARAAPCQS